MIFVSQKDEGEEKNVDKVQHFLGFVLTEVTPLRLFAIAEADTDDCCTKHSSSGYSDREGRVFQRHSSRDLLSLVWRNDQWIHFVLRAF